jgi:hypothetical protein
MHASGTQQLLARLKSNMRYLTNDRLRLSCPHTPMEETNLLARCHKWRRLPHSTSGDRKRNPPPPFPNLKVEQTLPCVPGSRAAAKLGPFKLVCSSFSGWTSCALASQLFDPGYSGANILAQLTALLAHGHLTALGEGLNYQSPRPS